MSNPSIASKMMTLVKGIFGQKKPVAAEPSAPAPAKETTDVRPEAEPKPEAAEETPAEETTAEAAELLAPEEKTALAEELAVAEAETQASSDEVLEQVRKDAAPEAEELPVPGYDELTLPSIRARLRKLSIEQVRELRAYEVAHQSRQEFIKMYDNRIAKLQSEDQ
ncbi:hypothetical protein [Allosalinactinospora lopnorensis]|uniref:hypothetical protein n=1 Tax=Allosalinactinospora lopnorensis TaxID=1352348 RepID=UPI000623C36D|nr:hypothetical protein [Allosalinactinospora lopnorensis]